MNTLAPVIKNSLLNCIRAVCVTLTMGIAIVPVMGGAKPVYLGPVNPGAEKGSEHWGHGAKGAGFTSFEQVDQKSGTNSFALGNTVAGWQNSADWRSDTFLLDSAADGDQSITFSFAYRLPGKVAEKDNVRVYLRFFNGTGKFLDQTIVRLGSNTRDSAMTEYKEVVRRNIFAPLGAQNADIWITANIVEPWTSGPAQFDDFSVTSISAWPSRSAMRIIIRAVVGLSLLVPAAIVAARYARQKRKPLT